MSEEDKKYTVTELFEAARKGMTWVGRSLENATLDEFGSIKMFLKEEDITQGIFAVRSPAIRDNYLKWCKARGLNEKSIVSTIKMNEYMKTRYGWSLGPDGRAILYYINKELQEDEENKKKRQEAIKAKIKNKGSKAKKETLGSGETDV